MCFPHPYFPDLGIIPGLISFLDYEAGISLRVGGSPRKVQIKFCLVVLETTILGLHPELRGGVGVVLLYQHLIAV